MRFRSWTCLLTNMPSRVTVLVIMWVELVDCMVERVDDGLLASVCCAVHTSQFLLTAFLPDNSERRVTHSTNTLAQTASPVEVRLQAELRDRRDFRPNRRRRRRRSYWRRRRRTMTRCDTRRVRMIHLAAEPTISRLHDDDDVLWPICNKQNRLNTRHHHHHHHHPK